MKENVTSSHRAKSVALWATVLASSAMPALAQTCAPNSSLGGCLGLTVPNGAQSPIVLPGSNNVLRLSQASNNAVAGPGSLATQSLDSLFDNASAVGNVPATESKPEGEAAKTQATPAQSVTQSSPTISVGALWSSYTTAGNKTKRLTVPLSYSIQSEMDPGRRITFRLPISQTSNAGRTDHHFGLGVDYRLPLTDTWILSSFANYTRAQSLEFANNGKGNIWSAGATSLYNFEREDNSTITIANMLALVQTNGLDAKLNANQQTKQQNAILRNGLMYATPVEIKNNRLGLQMFVAHTYIAGDKVLDRSFAEVGMSLGTGKNAFSARDYIRLGASYTKSANTHGINLNFGYWF